MIKNQKQSITIGTCLIGFTAFAFYTASSIRQKAEQVVKERKVVTCEQLARGDRKDFKYVTLTDFEGYKPFYCLDKHTLTFKPVYDGNYWDGDYSLIPLYATTEYNQQPCNALVQVVLDTHCLAPPVSPEILQQLMNRRVDGEITWLTEHDKESLKRHFPGIRPFLCRVVALGRWTPTQRSADQQWWIAVGACVIGIPLVVLGIYGKFRRKPQQGLLSDEMTYVW